MAKSHPNRYERAGLSIVRVALEQLRPLPALVLAAGVLHWLGDPPPTDPDPAQGAVEVLADVWDLSASPSDVHWIEPATRTGSWPRVSSRAWVLAERPGLGNDVFLIRTTRTREGQLLRVNAVHAVTDTFAVDEDHLTADGERAAWSTGDAERSYRVHVADLGTPRELPQELNPRERWQWRVTWLQELGTLDGLSQRSFKLDPPPRRLRVAVAGESTRLDLDGELAEIPRHDPPTRGARFLREEPHALPAPGNAVTWAVDRVRAFPWFGDERMQLIKAVAYRALDWVELTTGLELGSEAPSEALTTGVQSLVPVADRVAGDPTSSAPNLDAAQLANPAWPPAPIPPRLTPAWEREGEWQSLRGDPFVRPPPDLETSFLTTVIRVDEKRPFSRVLIVLWDPSLIDLRMMSGTEEPKSATGATGEGRVPRAPALLRRLVGAFNGGFQSTHGAWGMQVDGTTYVPPRPYAATVARLDDGSTAFGTWPEATPIPANFDSFRQNLTPLVQDGQKNPYERIWWGGVPEGWNDDTQTVRSGLCRTRAGFVAYFYGTKTDADHLADAMLAAECIYGLHLDMNQGHTGFEFYVADDADALPPLALPLDGVWQAEGPLDDAPGFRFRGRRLFRGMQLMNFPRYARREARDFFYLTLRPSLPGAPITGLPHPVGDEGRWSTADLPQFGHPHAIATTTVRPDADRSELKLHLAKLDPARFEPVSERPDERLVASFGSPAAEGTHAILWRGGTLHDASSLEPHPDPDPTTVVLFRGHDRPGEAVAAAGIGSDGMLVYAELSSRGGASGVEAAHALGEAARLAGAERIVYLKHAAGMVVGGRDLSRHPTPAPFHGVHAVRRDRPGFQDIFKDTPVVKPKLWQPLQRRLQD